jgi:hypothetical protein
MPRFVAQILAENEDVIINNVEVWIDFYPPGQVHQPFDGRFSLPLVPKRDPLKDFPRCIIQLNDGRRGKIYLTSAFANNQTIQFDIKFASNDPLE